VNGMRHEIMNYTLEQVRGHLADALELVSELEPAEELRPSVFVQAVSLLAQKQIVVEQVAPPLGLPRLG
jgi:hypothetical protein